MNCKFFHLRIKHNVRQMSTYTESACIYALFEITDKFFTHLSPDVSNHTFDFSLEVKKSAWFVGVYLGFHEAPQEEITRNKIARSW